MSISFSYKSRRILDGVRRKLNVVMEPVSKRTIHYIMVYNQKFQICLFYCLPDKTQTEKIKSP